MSHYAKFESQVTDREALVRALCQVANPVTHKNFTRDQIEVHDDAQHLYGYQGDKRPQKANVIIRRKNVGGASNDIGFVLEDGVYKPIISEFDQSQGYSNAWLNKCYTRYNVEKSKIELESRNIPYVESRDEKGRTQIVARFKTGDNRLRERGAR
jgi:hypothetical protein